MDLSELKVGDEVVVQYCRNGIWGSTKIAKVSKVTHKQICIGHGLLMDKFSRETGLDIARINRRITTDPDAIAEVKRRDKAERQLREQEAAAKAAHEATPEYQLARAIVCWSYDNCWEQLGIEKLRQIAAIIGIEKD